MKKLVILSTLLLSGAISSQINKRKVSEPLRIELPGDQTNPIFSNSGKYLAYLSNQNGPWQVWIHDFKTGKNTWITNSDNNHKDLQWSPNDKYLSFSSGSHGKSSVLLYEFASERIDTLTQIKQNASKARWSPDGDKLVMDFNAEGKNIWEFDLIKKKFNQVTSFPGEESNFGYSHDGKWIGYTSRGTNFPHLHAIQTKTRQVKRLVEKQKGFEWHPRWSMKRFEIAFYSTWNDEMTDVWITDGTPEGLTRITNKKVEEFGPALNYTENLVAFFTWDQTNDISIYNREKGTQKNLGLKEKMAVKWNPLSWSPTENRLAFLGWNQKDRIYSVSTSAQEKSKLFMPSRKDAHEIHPNMSFDGRFLLFNEGHKVIVRDLNQSQEVVINPEQSQYVESRPTWLPGSNEYISFILELGGASDTNNIWMMNRDGTRKKKLTDFGGIKNFCWIDENNLIFGYDSTTSYDNYDIWTYKLGAKKPVPLLTDPNATLVPNSVSPDGTHLLFTANFSGSESIYIMSLNDKKYEVVNVSKQASKTGIFSPDGNQIAFLSNDNPEKTYDIYITPTAGGATKRLTNSPYEEHGLTWSADGNYIIYAANPSDKDIYVMDIE